jgi:hypothetical protein
MLINTFKNGLITSLWVVSLTCAPAYADAPAYQKTESDESLQRMLTRWAEHEGYTVHWNAVYDIDLKKSRGNLSDFNDEMRKSKSIENAVDRALLLVRGTIDGGEPVPLAMCVFSNREIAIYAANQPNCGIKAIR